MLLGEPLQLGYATTNLEQARAVFKDRYGISKFLRSDVSSGLDVGRPRSFRVAHAWLGSTWIELVEPVDGDVEHYRSWLPKEGFAIRFHHVGIRIPDLEAWDRVEAKVDQLGCNVVYKSISQTHKMIFVDAVAELGHYVEYMLFEDRDDSLAASIPRNIAAC